ncbi:MAG: hypothetical protein JXA10_05280 [Anaerolineae bacterium]|nr:hypothetical protein [Anaerolineae bacterium]
MFNQINPVHEQRRAENTVRALTDQTQAANLFARQEKRNCAQDEPAHTVAKGETISIMRLFKAIRVNRPEIEPAAPISYADKRATLTS